jgi:abhydrolase domain-containing protein 6
MEWLGQLVLLVLRQQNRFRYRLKFRRWKANGYEVAYLHSSRRKTRLTLVFLHGLGASKDQWGSHIYSLVHSYNCVFLDLPGEGESSFDGAQSYSPMIQVMRLKAFFDTRSMNDIALIGTSMGGCIASLYAAIYPAKISRLITIAPAGLAAARPSPAMSQFLESGNHPFGYQTVSEMLEFWEIVFTQIPKVPTFLAKALASRGALRRPCIEKILGDFKDSGLYPLQTKLSDVRARTLVIWGSNDHIFDISCLEQMNSLLPQANVCIIEGAGHVPYLEHGEQTLDAIKQFLK